jgi:hypothetical protein
MSGQLVDGETMSVVPAHRHVRKLPVTLPVWMEERGDQSPVDLIDLVAQHFQRRTTPHGLAVNQRFLQRRGGINLVAQHVALRLYDGVRKRIKRGSIRYERDSHGRVYVWVDPSETQQDPSPDETQDMSAKDETIAILREQLAAERKANEENRRLLLAALERIPALEAPESPETPSEPGSDTRAPGRETSAQEASYEEASFEEPRPSWWRRWWR